MKRFALIGVAGYIAPRHLAAIHETGNTLVAALDPSDSVGILDAHFPDADFFTEFERFDRHIDKLRRDGQPIDYVSICSPNYLHDSHIRFALRSGAHAICEKPVVLNPWNVDALQEIQRESGLRVSTIQQLRLHPTIVALKERVTGSTETHDIELTYITSRGRWYGFSWKGDLTKSGGIATNIGIHFFDMLTWIFGDVQSSAVHVSTGDRAAGFLRLKNARVRWFLSINRADLPAAVGGGPTYRSIQVDGAELEFSTGFTDLHTRSYEQILAGAGFDLATARPSIVLAHEIRNAELSAPSGDDVHPFVRGI